MGSLYYKKAVNFFKNKYFLIGNLAFLILAIPVVMYLVRTQTTTRSGAVASSTLSFSPSTISTTECSSASQSTLVLNPGQNAVGSIALTFNWDSSKYDVDFTPNSSAFPQILSGPTKTAGSYSVTLNVGDVTKAITTTTNVGTVTITPSGSGTAANLTLNSGSVAIYSLAAADGPNENVYNASGSNPLVVNIATCGGVTPTVTPTSTPAVSPTGTVAPTATNTPTTTPTPTNTPTPTATSSSNNSGGSGDGLSDGRSDGLSDGRGSSSTTQSNSSTAKVSPSIAEPGGVTPTIAILGGALLIILAGVLLLAL